MSRDRLAAMRAQTGAAPTYGGGPSSNDDYGRGPRSDYDSSSSSSRGYPPMRQRSDYDDAPSTRSPPRPSAVGLPSGPRAGGGNAPRPRRQDTYGSQDSSQQRTYAGRNVPDDAFSTKSYSGRGRERQPNPYAQQDSDTGDPYGYGGGGSSYPPSVNEKASSVAPSYATNPFAGGSVASGIDSYGKQQGGFAPPMPGGGGGMDDFFDRISTLQSSLRSLSSLITTLTTLHTRLNSLPSTDSPQHSTLSSQLSSAQSESRSLNTQLKREIQSLTAETKRLASTPGAISQQDVDLRLAQISQIQRRFVDLIQQQAGAEKESRDASRRKLERQVKIVNPTYSESEVRQAADDIASGQGDVFQQAMAGGQRMAGARGALSEVQRRQEEIQRIERAITELAQLFSDMAVLVEEQDVKIVAMEKNAELAVVDIEKATTQLGVAKVSAKKARKKRIWCFVILVIVLIAAGAAVAIFVFHVGGVGKKKDDSSSSSSNSTSSDSSSSGSTRRRHLSLLFPHSPLPLPLPVPPPLF